MSKKMMAALLTIMLAGAGSVAMAAGGGHGGNGGGHGGGNGGGDGGAGAASHMSDKGLSNTNGPNAVDRDKGLERAEDRMSDQGLAHSKAEAKHKTHTPVRKHKPVKPAEVKPQS